MHIRTSREVILPAVTKIGNIVERRQTLPILSNMHLNLSGDKLTLTATDLEVEVRTFENVESEGEGEITLSARKVIDICRALPDKSIIEISVSGDRAIIKSGKSKFTLGILPASDYPSIDISESEFSFVLKESTLKKLIEKTSFSMAQQDVRYYLNGMLMELDKDTIKSVATDGHRLALCERTISLDFDPKKQYLIPRKAVIELARMLDYTDDEVRIEFCSNLARFSIRETTFTTKLIDGKFPDYNRVVPTICDKRAVIDREYFRNALVRASILSSEKYKGIRLTFKNKTLKIQAHNPEQEEAEEELEMDYEDEPITIGFNVGYLLDIFNTMSSEKVILDLANSNSSALVKDPEDEGAVYVLMPMRL